MAAAAITPARPGPMLSPALRGTVWGLAAVTIWGVYLAFARANVSAGVMPSDLAFVRYAVAGAIMLPWLLRHSPGTLAGIGWRHGVVLSLLAGPLFILAGASGFLFAPLSHGAVVQPATITIAGLALGALILGDRLTRMRVVGASTILVGLALVAGPAAISGGLRALAGDALFALAGLMWAGFAVLSKRWSVSPIAATAVVSVLSALIYAPLFLATRGADALLAQPAATLVQQVVVQGVLSGVVAVFAFGRAVELLGAPRAAAFPALVPVVAILTGVPVTGELPTLLQAAGLVTVTAGLLVTQRRPS
jgi:drug/metabolite transporter (DMT)-like permease